jgi:hypothetical protein
MMNTFNHSVWGPGMFWGIGPVGALFGGLMLVFVIAIITLKGYALWYAAKRDEKWWFAIMLVVNTAGILELIYLLFVVHRVHDRKPKHPEGHTTHEHHDHG